MLAGLQIEKRPAPGIVTLEVFTRAFGLLAGHLPVALDHNRASQPCEAGG